MPVLPGDVMMQTDMDYDSIAKAGSMLGSGAVIIMDETRCMVRSLCAVYFYYEESCGQCTPCREGTGWLYRMVDRIERGEGRNEDLDVLNNVADNIAGRTICALGDAAALPGEELHQALPRRVPAPHRPQEVPRRSVHLGNG
jgi:NADH-quinone oxidoreductase subunit F